MGTSKALIWAIKSFSTLLCFTINKEFVNKRKQVLFQPCFNCQKKLLKSKFVEDHKSFDFKPFIVLYLILLSCKQILFPFVDNLPNSLIKAKQKKILKPNNYAGSLLNMLFQKKWSFFLEYLGAYYFLLAEIFLKVSNWKLMKNKIGTMGYTRMYSTIPKFSLKE